MDGSAIYTVSELTREIRDLLERRLGLVWVTGEISNLRRPASGHCYFTFKDEHAQLSAVLWRTLASRLQFDLKDGMAAVIQGELTVYEPRGQYQVVVRRIEPVGVGALQLAFQQLKERLAAEGLFDKDRKKPLPKFPNRIGIVTSPTGAAIRDMLNILASRFPKTQVLVLPARVQGDAAAGEIAAAIAHANRIADLDLLIVGRGGGSLEDLWPFNEEVVARAIVASRIPIISAVGHETDFTIADFVADARALTPTDAANRAVPDARELADALKSVGVRLGQALLRRVSTATERLDALARSYVFRRPLDRIRLREQRLDDLCQQLVRGVGHVLQLQKQRTEGAAARLEAVSPLAVLGRGYAIVFKEPELTIVRDARTLKAGDLIRSRVAKGEFTAKVETASARAKPAAKPKRRTRAAPKRKSARKPKT